MLETDVTIIGAGVVGLAIAARVAGPGRRVLVLEKNPGFGQETSSRHSGVIHAGIYYPEGSLKATLCLQGNALLYEICQRHGVPFKRLGKLIIATDPAEAEQLESLHQQGKRNGVAGLKLLSPKGLEAMETNVAGVAALLSPSTGIVDSHALMRLFLNQARERGAMVAFQTEVTAVEKRRDGYLVTVREPGGQDSLATSVLINCAGLASQRIAEMVGIDAERAGYRLHYCKGEYFSLSRGNLVQRLVYPVPETGGLGIHVTTDMEGRTRLGPNARYVDGISYRVDGSQRGPFCQAVQRFLPMIQYHDLEPDFAGIRPKLQGPGEGFRDFVIRHEQDKGFPGLINLIGIESPGLTCAPAIAEVVRGMVEGLL